MSIKNLIKKYSKKDISKATINFQLNEDKKTFLEEIASLYKTTVSELCRIAIYELIEKGLEEKKNEKPE